MSNIIVGDLHGEWGPLNTLINKKAPKNIIQLGDFGWWPHFHGKTGLVGRYKVFNQFGIKPKQTKVFWVPGNHENWNDLKCITDYTPLEIQEGVTYCPFGTVLEIKGTKILCCGGAASIDKKFRTEDLDWWRKEVIDQEDMDNLPDTNIDIVVSHTAPRSFIKKAKWEITTKHRDSSTFALDLVLENYKPKAWFSGHFHKFKKMKIDGCEWVSLAMPNVHETWWQFLDI